MDAKEVHCLRLSASLRCQIAPRVCNRAARILARHELASPSFYLYGCLIAPT